MWSECAPVSFEFFPPKTDAGLERLRSAWFELGAFDPAYLSCTFGAGGSARTRTHDTVLAMHRAGYRAAPHLCCAGMTESELSAILDAYVASGIRDIVALRGDARDENAGGDFQHASDLVAWIRGRTGNHFRIAVACYPECHPEARNSHDDLRHLKLKVDVGADWAITQYFYCVDAYCRFIDDCRTAGIDIPIVPGIMPIADVTQLTRFSDACGADIPRWLRMKLQSYDNDPVSLQRFGLDVVTDLCDRLLSFGAPGLHFYTLNQPALTSTICRRLHFCASATAHDLACRM
jgi:methylenetetrahydrofolate reductase (NADPH)